jgi:two-component system LytT family response regulator
MIRTLIVDDIQKLRESLKDLLAKNCPSVEIIGEAANVGDALKQIGKLKPDLVFLDIELSDGTAFELLSKLKSIAFKVIFVTAYNEYAIKAFKFSALDYLLKPVDRDDLINAVQKAEAVIQKEQLGEKIQVLLSHITPPVLNARKIVLRTAERIYSVSIEDIVRCESDKNYTTFYMKDRKKLLVSTTLKEYDDMLAAHGFARVHQSHLINMAYFDHFLKNDGGYAVMKDTSQVPISSRKRQEFIELIERT